MQEDEVLARTLMFQDRIASSPMKKSQMDEDALIAKNLEMEYEMQQQSNYRTPSNPYIGLPINVYASFHLSKCDDQSTFCFNFYRYSQKISSDNS